MTTKQAAQSPKTTTIILPLAAVPESCDVEVNDSNQIVESFLYDKGSPMPKEVQALKEGDRVRIDGPAKQFPENEVWVVDYIDLPGYEKGEPHFATLGIAYPKGCPKRYRGHYKEMVARAEAMAAASKRAQEATG